jgi:hypothetical protein
MQTIKVTTEEAFWDALPHTDDVWWTDESQDGVHMKVGGSDKLQVRIEWVYGQYQYQRSLTSGLSQNRERTQNADGTWGEWTPWG